LIKLRNIVEIFETDKFLLHGIITLFSVVADSRIHIFTTILL